MINNIKVKFSQIKWDTDGQRANLPKRVTLDVPKGTDVMNQGADILSDKYGFCVFSFNFKIP